MNNPNCWRVPIPTDILTSGLDIFSQMLYIYILVKCTNKPYTYVWMHGNKRVSVKLDRGQCLLNVSEIERMLNLPQRTVKRCIKLINESTNELQIESKPYCTIVTVKNYDEVIKMSNESTNESTNEVQTKYKRSTNEVQSNNKIDKNVENEKNEKKIIRPKTLNLKELESSNPPYTPPLAEMLDETIKHFNDRLGKRYKSTKSLLGNFEKWTEVYSLDEIKSAIDVLPRHHFWKDKMTPTILFRTMGRDKNPVDYIGDLLNYSPTSTTIEPKDNLKNWI